MILIILHLLKFVFGDDGDGFGCGVRPGALTREWDVDFVTAGSGLTLAQGSGNTVIPALDLVVKMEDWYFDKGIAAGYTNNATDQESPTFSYPAFCNALPTVEDAQYTQNCWEQFTVSINYLANCNFTVVPNVEITTNGESALFTTFDGWLQIDALVDIAFLNDFVPRTLGRPLGFRVLLPETISVSTDIEIINDDLCFNNTDCSNNGNCTDDANQIKRCFCEPCWAYGPENTTGQWCGVDTCMPQLTCPGQQAIWLYGNLSGAILTNAQGVAPTLPTASDLSELSWERKIGGGAWVASSPGGSFDHTSDDLLSLQFPLGDTDVQYRVTDGITTPNTCLFKVSVLDKAPPQLTCPDDLLTNSDYTPNSADVTVQDLIDTLVDLEVSHTIVTNEGTTQVTWTGTDDSDNEGTCTFEVTVDKTPPSIECDDHIFDTDTYETYATFSLTAPNYADNGGGSGILNGSFTAVIVNSAQHNANGLGNGQYEMGLYTPDEWTPAHRTHLEFIEYTVEDNAGNSYSCIESVRVCDDEPPKVAVPEDQIRVALSGNDFFSMDPYVLTLLEQDNVNALDGAGDALLYSNLYLVPSIGDPVLLVAGNAYAFPLGNTTLMFRAVQTWDSDSDCNGGNLMAEATFIIQVIDTEPPTIACPSTPPVCIPNGNANYTFPGASAICDDNDAIASCDMLSPAINSVHGPGSVNITFEATDSSGLTTQKVCSFTVKDCEPPRITCPEGNQASYTVEITSDSPCATFNVVDATADDFVHPSPAVNGTCAPSICVAPGAPATCVFYANDYVNPLQSCQFTVTAVDRHDPICETTDLFYEVWTPINVLSALSSSYDNIGIVSTTYQEPQAFFSDADTPTLAITTKHLGTRAVSVTVEDAEGNTGECPFNLTVSGKCGDLFLDRLGLYGPSEHCEHTDPALASCNTTTCLCANDYHLVNGTCLQLCLPPSCDPPGPCLNTFSVANASSVTVWDTDTHTEVWNNDNVTAEYNEFYATSQLFLEHSDLVMEWFPYSGSVENPIPIVASFPAGEYGTLEICCEEFDHEVIAIIFPNGSDSAVNTVDYCQSLGTNANKTYTVETGCYSFPVCAPGIVDVGLERSAGFMNCSDLSTIYATTTNGVSVAVSWNQTDRVYVSPDVVGTITYDVSPPSGSLFEPGSHLVTLLASDNLPPYAQGAVCQWYVHVTDGVPPTVFCPAIDNITIYLDEGAASANYTLDPFFVYFQDETDPTTNTEIPPVGIQDYYTVAGSPYTISYNTAQDAAGNDGEDCEITLIVVDNHGPILTCTDIDQCMDFGTDEYAIASIGFSSNDNIDGPQQHTYVFPSNLSSNTSYTVSHTDSSGIPTTKDCSILIKDCEDPKITCPANIEIPSSASQEVVTWNLSTSDNVAVTHTSVSLASGATLLVPSTHTVTATANDDMYLAETNAAECSFIINITDVAPPVLTCPSPVVMYIVPPSNASTMDVDAALWTATSTDNDLSYSHPPPSLVGDHDVGVPFPIGITYILWTATDPSGNQGSVTCQVTIFDWVPPTPVNCPSSTIVLSSNGQYSPGQAINDAYPALDSLYFTDNVGVINDWAAQQSLTATLDDLDPLSFSYYALDAAGNKNWCNFTVQLEDDTPPEVTCPGNRTILLSTCLTEHVPGNCTYDYEIISIDEYGNGANITETNVALTLNGNVFTEDVNDGNGNSATCDWIVTVVDDVPPTVTCPANQTYRILTPGANDHDWYYVKGATSLDNVATDLASEIYSSAYPLLVTVGSPETVCYTIDDTSGNAAEPCCFTLTVLPPFSEPVLAPVLTKVKVYELDCPDAFGLCDFGILMEYLTGTVYPHDGNLDPAADLLPGASSNLNTGPDGHHTTGTKAPTIMEVSELSYSYDGKADCDAGVIGAICLKKYRIVSEFTDCDSVESAFQMQHTTTCVPGDCSKSSAPTVTLTLNAENYCQQTLAEVVITALITTVTPADKDLYIAAYENAITVENANSAFGLPDLPPKQTQFDNNAIVCGIVQVNSDAALIETMLLKSAQRDVIDALDGVKVDAVTTDLVELVVASGSSGTPVGAETTMQDGFINIGWFCYREVALAPQEQIFVRLTAFMEISYILTSGQVGRRRLSASFEAPTQSKMHRNLQALLPQLPLHQRQLLQGPAQQGSQTSETQFGVVFAARNGQNGGGPAVVEAALPQWVFVVLAVVLVLGALACCCLGGVCYFIGWKNKRDRKDLARSPIRSGAPDSARAEPRNLTEMAPTNVYLSPAAPRGPGLVSQ